MRKNIAALYWTRSRGPGAGVNHLQNAVVGIEIFTRGRVTGSMVGLVADAGMEIVCG